MAVERHYNGLRSQSFRLLFHLFYQITMPPMHTVEETDSGHTLRGDIIHIRIFNDCHIPID